MKVAITICVVTVGMALVLLAGAQPGAFSLRSVMSDSDYRAAGLHKLTPEELQALSNWLQSYSIDLVKHVQAKSSCGSDNEAGEDKLPRYRVEVSHGDDLFVVNGQKYEAKTYCFGVNEGDQVLFLEGSALGACTSAEFLNLRTGERCEVWCG